MRVMHDIMELHRRGVATRGRGFRSVGPRPLLQKNNLLLILLPLSKEIKSLSH